MTKELLQQALDALLPHSSSHGNSWRSVEDAAIKAIEQALAQQEHLHVGEGSFETWYQSYARQGISKQVARDAYAAGMSDPLVKAQQDQPASVDAYVGAREDAAIWKKRALEAEELNRKFIAEVNGPTYLGEPAQQEQPASVDAYVGAREDAAIWKKRALESEELNRKFIAEVNGSTYLGEPTQPAQEPCSVRITWTKLGTKFTDFFDFDNPACPISRDGNWKQDHWNARHLRQGNTGVKLVKLESVIMLYTHPATTQPALSDEQILDIFSKVSADGMGHYMTAVGRAIEAHCRGGVGK